MRDFRVRDVVDAAAVLRAEPGAQFRLAALSLLAVSTVLPACGGSLFSIRIEDTAETTVPEGTIVENLTGGLGFSSFTAMDLTESEDEGVNRAGEVPETVSDPTETTDETSVTEEGTVVLVATTDDRVVGFTQGYVTDRRERVGEIDQEAFRRGTSVYMVDRVIPMLPEIISNGLCSLNPEVDRLCLCCDMLISKQGRVSKFTFREGVMRSTHRLTYNKESLRNPSLITVGDPSWDWQAFMPQPNR